MDKKTFINYVLIIMIGIVASNLVSRLTERLWLMAKSALREPATGTYYR